MKHPVAQQAVAGAHDGRVSEEQELVRGQVGKHADGDRALHVDVPSESAGDVLQFESAENIVVTKRDGHLLRRVRGIIK